MTTTLAEAPVPAGSLSGVRVAEFGAGPALGFCGKLFADFGAEVVKVEPPGGDPDRRAPPLLDVGDGGRGESGFFAWLATNKRSIVVDPDDSERLRQIAGGCDVLIDSRPGAGWAAGPAGQSALRAAFPHLTIVSLSWFGESGPYRGFAGADAVVRALAGLVRSAGPAGAPALQPEHQTYAPAALSGFTAALAALLGGGGRRFEISLHEASVVAAEFPAAVILQTEAPERRWGRNRWFPVFPVGIYPTRDGWLGVTALTADQWRGFCDLLGMERQLRDSGYSTATERLMRADELDAVIGPALLTRTARDWAEEGLRRRVPLVVVPDMAQLLASPAHRAHGAFGVVRIGAASFEAPVLAQRLTATPPAAAGVAPLTGADTATWTAPPAAPRAARAEGLPLAGSRVIDLTMGWAGPLATRQLADLGAEVIKVEGRAYPDWWRTADYSEAAIAAQVHEKSLYFNMMNRNKTGITLDLTQATGAELLRRLAGAADVVIENYSQGVLPKLGLDYPSLRQARPDLVMVSMPAFGAETALADLRAYGSTLEHASGLPQVTGAPDWPPTMNHVAYGDPIGGLSACPAVLAALLHRKRTGEGQFIDLSQVECMFPLVAPWIIEQSITGKVAARMGNRHPRFVPHGCFPCAGEDAWVVIAVTGDAEWQALCQAIERTDLAADPKLATAEGRRAAEDLLEAAITSWTRRRSADEAMLALQALGVAAGAARGLVELMLYEPHLAARGFWQEVDRPHLDWRLQASPVFREDGRPYPIRRPAPTLGQSTREVLARLLGLRDADLDRLEREHVIGEAPIASAQRRPRSAALLHAAGGDS